MKVATTLGLLVSILTKRSTFASSTRDDDERRQLLRLPKKEISNEQGNKVLPFQDICPEEYPPKHAMLHDKRRNEIEEYEKFMGIQVHDWNFAGTPSVEEEPEIVTVQDYKYAVWNTQHPYESESSAWNPNDSNPNENYIGNNNANMLSSGWVKPGRPFMHVHEVLEDDGTTEWVGFSSWFIGNYGHFVHDHLPTIAFLRSIVPETAKFLLVDSKVSRMVLKAIDSDFYENRIKWINLDEVYHIRGKLTVALRHSYQITIGCCNAFDPMRRWIAEAKPHMPTEAKDRLIIYYSRSPTDGVTHGRVIEHEHETDVVKHIQAAMKRHNVQENFIVFNGKGHNSTRLPVEIQLSLFRNARTIIGPRGSGLGGNFAWTNPFPQNCAERTQLLEFIPGTDSIKEGDTYPFTSYYNIIRKWPLDYHNIVYTAQSTSDTTYINLDDLDSALDWLWGGGDPSMNSLSSLHVSGNNTDSI